jgi:hypothetical protein
MFFPRATLDHLEKLEVKVFLGKSENRAQKAPKEIEVEEVQRAIGAIWEHQDTKEIWERRASVA